MNSAQRSKDLLVQLRSKQLTLEEYLYKCAMWQLEPIEWAEVILKQYPIAPASWQEYETMSLKEKSRIDASFFNDTEVFKYLKQCEDVFGSNLSHYSYLKDMLDVIPDDEQHAQYIKQIHEKLDMFVRWLQNDKRSKNMVLDKKEVKRVKPVTEVGATVADWMKQQAGDKTDEQEEDNFFRESLFDKEG